MHVGEPSFLGGDGLPGGAGPGFGAGAYPVRTPQAGRARFGLSAAMRILGSAFRHVPGPVDFTFRVLIDCKTENAPELNRTPNLQRTPFPEHQKK